MDIEYDEFIQMEAPDTQIIVIAVISSMWVFLFVFTTTSIQILYSYCTTNILKGIEFISVILFPSKKP